MRAHLLVLLTLIAPLAMAQSPVEGKTKARIRTETERELATVQVTATRRAESTSDVPVAMTVVSRETIRKLAPQTVMDALHGEPGTFVQQTTPGQGVVIVRGLKGSEVLHLVDGFRLNNAIFRNAPNQYIALVDAQSLDRIEVVRGPMSTLYGGDAMGGVVQMLSWEPRFAGGAWDHDAGVRAIYGSADGSFLTRADGAVGNDALVISGGATYQDVHTLRVGGGDELPFTAFTSRAADLKVRAQLADGHELTASAQYLEQPRTPRFDELVPGFGQTRPTSSTFLFEPQQREFYHLRYKGTVSTPLFDSLEAHLGRQRIVDDRRSRDFNSANEDREENTVVTDGITMQAGRALGDQHYVTAGMEYYDDEVSSSRRRLDIDSGALANRASRFPDGSTMRQFGAFLTDDWKASDTWDFNYGLRYSRIRTELPQAIDDIGVSSDHDAVSGSLGIAYALRDGLKLVANAGRGFRAPNVFDLGTFGSRPGNRFNIPNPDLTPETVDTVDFGFKYDGARATGEAIAFRSEYKDKITSVLTGDVTGNGALIVQNRNVTTLDLWGIEAGTRYYARDDLTLYASATYTRGEERFQGEVYPADRIPPLFGKLGAEWNWRDDVAIEGYLFYSAEQARLSPRDAADPRINPNGTAGYATLNARIAWQAGEDLSLALRLENLGDKRYREHGTGLDEPGFSAIATVDWRF